MFRWSGWVGKERVSGAEFGGGHFGAKRACRLWGNEGIGGAEALQTRPAPEDLQVCKVCLTLEKRKMFLIWGDDECTDPRKVSQIYSYLT